MFLSMPTSFVTPKTAAKPSLENQPPYAAVSVSTKPLHMVVFLSLEIVLLSQGVKNPRFLNRGFTLLYVVFVCLREHGPADPDSEVFLYFVVYP